MELEASHTVRGIIFGILVTLGTACGSEVIDSRSAPIIGGTTNDVVPQSTATNDVEDAVYVANVASRPECNTQTEGKLIFVVDVKEFQTCALGAWSVVDVTGKAVDVYALTSELHKKYRRGIFRIEVTCSTDGFISRGTGFRCGPNKVCTNAHVVTCDTTDAEEMQIYAVGPTDDTANPNDEERLIYDGTNFTLDKGTNRDLAKITVSGLPEYATELPIATRPVQEHSNTGTPVASMGFPLGFDELVVDVGNVNSNAISTHSLPNDIYDFQTSNDTDSGSSGSPIINVRTGQVIGLVTAGLSGGGASDPAFNPSIAVDAYYFKDLD